MQLRETAIRRKSRQYITVSGRFMLSYRVQCYPVEIRRPEVRWCGARQMNNVPSATVDEWPECERVRERETKTDRQRQRET